MSIIKPQTLVHDQTVLQHEGKYYAIISAVMGFKLRNPKKLMHERDFDSLWEELKMEGIPINEGFIKPKAEVIMVGKIPTPKKHKRYTMRLQMNGIDKSMVVFSPRKWVPGPLGTFVMAWDDAEQSESKKGEGLYLSWQNAWGGEGYTQNLQGTGYAKGFIAGRSKLYEGVKVPPFEVIAPGIQSPSDQAIPPAGFSPIHMTDPRRFQYFHESPDYWQEAGLPTLPKDFDFKFFQQAPVDQQREEKFIPGERYRIELGDTILEGTLPQFKVRLLLADAKFERMLKKMEGDSINDIIEYEPENPLPDWFNMHSLEQAMQVDTLILIPEQMKGIVISRACFEVQNVHMNEWEHTLLALEHPDTPRTLQELQQSLCEHLQDAALRKPSDAGLTADKTMSKELRQKAKADKIFAKMHQDAKKIKPSQFASQEVRIKASPAAIIKAKDLNFIDYDFRAGELVEAKLNGLKFQNCTFTNIDFTESMLNECNFLDCRFYNCIFYQSKISSCQVINCRFVEGDWRQSEIKNTQLQEVIFHKTLLNQAIISSCHWVDVQLLNVTVQESVWAEVHIVGGMWQQCDLSKAKFVELRVQKLLIKDSNLAQVKAQKCMFNDTGMAFIRVNLNESEWEAPNFMQSYWYKVGVERAVMLNGVWGFSKIIHTHFKEVALNDSLFADSKFLRSSISYSNLKNSVFAGAWLKDSNIEEGNNLILVNLKHTVFIEGQQKQA